jgi:hypothetical protein
MDGRDALRAGPSICKSSDVKSSELDAEVAPRWWSGGNLSMSADPFLAFRSITDVFGGAWDRGSLRFRRRVPGCAPRLAGDTRLQSSISDAMPKDRNADPGVGHRSSVTRRFD